MSTDELQQRLEVAGSSLRAAVAELDSAKADLTAATDAARTSLATTATTHQTVTQTVGLIAQILQRATKLAHSAQTLASEFDSEFRDALADYVASEERATSDVIEFRSGLSTLSGQLQALYQALGTTAAGPLNDMNAVSTLSREMDNAVAAMSGHRQAFADQLGEWSAVPASISFIDHWQTDVSRIGEQWSLLGSSPLDAELKALVSSIRDDIKTAVSDELSPSVTEAANKIKAEIDDGFERLTSAVTEAINKAVESGESMKSDAGALGEKNRAVEEIYDVIKPIADPIADALSAFGVVPSLDMPAIR